MNKPIQIIIWAIIILVVGIVSYLLVVDNGTNENTNTQTGNTYPLAGNYPNYSLEDLIADSQNDSLKAGQYNTEGYVIDVFSCPPCPAGAVCMPCTPDAIIVSETSIETEKQLRIEAENLGQFKIGQKYTFSITIDEITKDISLSGYTK